MTTQEIEQKVGEILSRKLKVDLDKINAQTRLAEDLGVDSFGALELMFEVEEAFNLKIPDSDIEHIRTVNDVVGYVEAWLEKASTARKS